MNEAPRELDWVNERHKCSVALIFQQLSLGVESDCYAFNAAHEIEQDVGFRVNATPDKRVFVVSSALNPRKVVRFLVGRTHIEVRNEETMEQFKIEITLNDEGRCMMVIEGKELEQWQVRRRVLEKFLFDEVLLTQLTPHM